MMKGNLTKEAMDRLEEELSRFELMGDYLTKTEQQKESFTSLKQAERFLLADGAIPINNIILMENSKGKTDILNISTTKYSQKEIEELAKETGLEEKDIISLLQDGMKIEDISAAVAQIPKTIKDISESAAIREMIKKDIKKGIQIVPMKDGSLQVDTIQKVAEIDEEGLVKFEPQLLESLKLFEQKGLIKLSDKIAVKEIEPQSRQKEHGNSLKVVSFAEKKEEQTKDEIEKQKMARGLNIDSDEIVSVIRIDDKDGGSKLLNDSRGMDDGPVYIIRTKNGYTENKFITAKGTRDGGYEQIQGFESTPAVKEVAASFKDTQNSMYTVALKPGEIRAGKMHSMDDDYKFFLIKRAGESIDNGSNSFLYVGTSGETDMSLIENRESGERQFVQLPVSRVYPSSIYLENNRGYGQKTELLTPDNDKANDEDVPQPEISFNDIIEKKKLLEKLKKIESRIVEIEDRNEKGPIEPDSAEMSENDARSRDSFDLNPNELDSLYTERSQILKQLGMDESKAIQEPEREEEFEHIPGQRKH